MSDDGNVVAVHNGIIENYQELKDKLIRNGYSFIHLQILKWQLNWWIIIIRNISEHR